MTNYKNKGMNYDYTLCVMYVVVQSLSDAWLLAIPRIVAHQAPLSSTVSKSLLHFMSIESDESSIYQMTWIKCQSNCCMKTSHSRGPQTSVHTSHQDDRWSIEKASELQKNYTSALLTTPKPLTVWITTNWKILQEMGIPDHLTCLLRHLYVGLKATVRTGHGTTDWFQIGKGVHQGCILSPCLFNLYAEYIMRNSGLNEAQAEIKIAGRKMTPPLRQKVKKN